VSKELLKYLIIYIFFLGNCVEDEEHACHGRRFSFDYFAHPTEKSQRAIPYNNFNRVVNFDAASQALEDDENYNYETHMNTEIPLENTERQTGK
jgi:hypothetical protein